MNTNLHDNRRLSVIRAAISPAVHPFAKVANKFRRRSLRPSQDYLRTASDDLFSPAEKIADLFVSLLTHPAFAVLFVLVAVRFASGRKILPHTVVRMVLFVVVFDIVERIFVDSDPVIGHRP